MFSDSQHHKGAGEVARGFQRMQDGLRYADLDHLHGNVGLLFSECLDPVDVRESSGGSTSAGHPPDSLLEGRHSPTSQSNGCLNCLDP